MKGKIYLSNLMWAFIVTQVNLIGL